MGLTIFLSIKVDAQSEYTNPIIPGFNPDPSICRVGEDYYIVTSTFEYFPGIPIYHSRDLVNWEMIGHVLSRPSQLNLDSIDCSGGINAPTIRYNNGIFYVVVGLVGHPKFPHLTNFIVTAKNPAGPWSEPHWLEKAEGGDPSLFFDDDGKIYYCVNFVPPVLLWNKHRNIWAQELDIKTWKLIGERKEVLDGGEFYKKGTLDGGIETGLNNYEAPHFYKKDGKYYLMIAHGGTGNNHAESIWKSDNVFGPYEFNTANPILTHRDMSYESYFTSTGHADLVQTQNGEWWMVYLARRPYGGDLHIMGRETFMSPVDWSGDWPIVNPNGKIGKGELTHKKPDLKEYKFEKQNPRDEFNSAQLQNMWTFIRTPRSNWWSLADRKGFLRIVLRPEKITDQANPSYIGKRQEHINFSASVKMEFKPSLENEEAGLVAELKKDSYLKCVMKNENGKNILSLSQKNGVESKDTTIAKAIVNENNLFLEISAKGHLYTFRYSYNGKDWTILKADVNGRLLGRDRFTGTMIGMYASSNGMKSKNHADFDWFEYNGD